MQYNANALFCQEAGFIVLYLLEGRESTKNHKRQGMYVTGQSVAYILFPSKL